MRGSHHRSRALTAIASAIALIAATLLATPAYAAATEIAVSADTTTANAGSTIDLAATLTSSDDEPFTGEVLWFVDGEFADITEIADGHSASFAYSEADAGTHAIVAEYSGDALHDAVQSTSIEVTFVTPVAPRLLVAVSWTVLTSPGPALAGQPITFEAQIAGRPYGGGDDMGTFRFIIDGSDVGDPMDAGPTGHTSLTLPDGVSVGEHTFEVVYSGALGLTGATSGQLRLAFEPGPSAGGPYSIAEGADLTLDGFTPVSYANISWDLNGDGDFTDATGAAPTLTWAQLQDLGIGDGPADYPIVMRTTVANTSLTSAGTLSIVDVPPVASIDGPATATAGQATTWKISALDPSLDDLAGQFDYTIDWGDGSPVEHVTGPADPPITHTYATVGEFTMTASVADADGASGEPITVPVTVTPAGSTDTPTDEPPTDEPPTDEPPSSTPPAQAPTTADTPPTQAPPAVAPSAPSSGPALAATGPAVPVGGLLASGTGFILLGVLLLLGTRRRTQAATDSPAA